MSDYILIMGTFYSFLQQSLKDSEVQFFMKMNNCNMKFQKNDMFTGNVDQKKFQVWSVNKMIK